MDHCHMSYLQKSELFTTYFRFIQREILTLYCQTILKIWLNIWGFILTLDKLSNNSYINLLSNEWLTFQTTALLTWGTII